MITLMFFLENPNVPVKYPKPVSKKKKNYMQIVMHNTLWKDKLFEQIYYNMFI